MDPFLYVGPSAEALDVGYHRFEWHNSGTTPFYEHQRRDFYLLFGAIANPDLTKQLTVRASPPLSNASSKACTGTICTWY